MIQIVPQGAQAQDPQPQQPQPIGAGNQYAARMLSALPPLEQQAPQDPPRNVFAERMLASLRAHGATDAVGYASVVDPVTTYDLHATVLHLLGIDNERLTFYHDGIRRRLTNVHLHVVK